MSAIDSLYKAIDDGKEGRNIGLDIGLPKLQSMTYGVQRQTYSVIAGGTGSGKTTLALYSYVYRVINDNLGDMRYRVIFFSFEMTAEILLAKLLSMHLWETFEVEATYADIMSREVEINAELYDKVVGARAWLTEVSKQLVIIDSPQTADSVYANLKAYAGRNGSETIGENGKIHYKPNRDGEIVQIIVDHLGLVKLTTREKKAEMDRLANYLLSIRNIYAYSPLVLMQINRTSSSMDRRKGGYSEIELSDLKDTGTAAEAAELVLALYNPWREKSGVHKGYNIKVLQDHYRAIQILKSRLGEAEKQVSVNFWGSVGTFVELPPAEDLARLSDNQLKKYTMLKPPTEDRVESVAPAGAYIFRL